MFNSHFELFLISLRNNYRYRDSVDLGFQKKELIPNQFSTINCHYQRLSIFVNFKVLKKLNQNFFFLKLEKRDLELN